MEMGIDLCPENYILSVEGLAKLCIPDVDRYRRADGVYEPSWAPVFYNPDMVENRDIAVAVVKILSYRGRVVAVDPLAATGVRGLRIYIEVGNGRNVEVFLGDISKEAVEIMEINRRLNGIESGLHINWMDANEYLFWLKRSGYSLDYIDIDPYGSPVEFLSSALLTVSNGGVVAVTATDLAVLEGKYRDKLYRRYGVVGLATSVSKSIAVRVLLSYIARIASSFDRYIEPLLTYTYKHYARVYVRVLKGASRSTSMLNECLGKIYYCERCGYREFVKKLNEPGLPSCPVCGSQLVKLEPIWICKTEDRETVLMIQKEVESMQWIQNSTRKLIEYLALVSNINNITFRLFHIAKLLHTNMPKRNSVVACLSGKGFRVVKDISYGDGILTDASIFDIIDCFKQRS